MEKFTIDLDQVLNDFEYKELTDQYISKNPPETHTSSSNQSGKHTINNVFHSLNEYLNTNINIQSLNSSDNNVKPNEKARTPSPVKEELNILSNTGESSKAGPCRNDLLKGQNCDLNKNVIDVHDCIEANVIEISNENIKTDDDTVNVVNDTVDSNKLEDNNLCKVVITNEISGQEEGHCDNESEPKTDLCLKDREPTINNDFKVSELSPEQENLTGIVKDESLADSTKEVMKESVAKEVEDKSGDESKTGIIIEKQTNKEAHFETVAEKVAETEDKFEAEPSNLSVAQEQEVIQETSNTLKIGFETDLNLDEQELNKLLEDLEEDEELKGHKSQDIASVTELECCKDIQPSLQNTSDDMNHVRDSDNVEINNDIAADVTNIIVTAAENNKDTPPNTEDIVEELTSDSISKESEEKAEQIDEAPTVETPAKPNDLEKETSQDSLSRPQNLPLKEAEEAKRNINLIGEPGSTPYNNVYIDKEIEQSHHESDSDSSTSSSPTFSDSNSASTASTEEIQDFDIPAGKNSLKQPSEQSGDNPSTVTVENFADKSPETENHKQADAPASAQTSTSAAGGDTAANDAPSEEGGNQPSPSIIPPDKYWLGKEAPLWVPDSDAVACLHCDMKFTVLKRRHHCRACGLVLCSKCCYLRFRLDYLEGDGRVCNKCYNILQARTQLEQWGSGSGSPSSPPGGGSPVDGASAAADAKGESPPRRPNPNNPLEYCSTVSPLQQVAQGAAGGLLGAVSRPPPAVMVPVGVLKRKGSNKAKSNKSVMFCDGIRPGSDLTNLDNDFNYNNTKTKKLEKTTTSAGKINRHLPIIDSQTNTFIPSNENSLPPTVTICKTEITYTECSNSAQLIETLKKEQVSFAIHINLYVHLKIIDMSCCINKWAWCFSTEGLINVGQDEVVYLIEYIDEETVVPKDVFHHINGIYSDAVKGQSISDLGVSLHSTPNFLGSKNHSGFVYIRPTFQCLENVIKPKDPYLIGILIHRWETPWAKLFPLRLVLRLGAEYRYYPSPIISTRNRDSVFVEIGHTIINLLADFRNFSYTLPQIRGLTIHMEDKNTTVTIPMNRYDQVVKSLNNSSDHILAFAGNFSSQADSHLVCIQDTQGNEDCYTTHAINIQNKPRKITGACFIVFNGALKSTSGLTAKSNIVEDGLMIQVLPEHMQQIREHLRTMKNHTISCGPVNSSSDETVNIIWGGNDVNFNVGIVSAIDSLSLSGIPSIRVHNGKNHMSLNGNRIIRWTEVFVLESGGEENPKNQDPVDVSRISETIAKACCEALVKYLDLLLANNFQKVAVRTTLRLDDVAYVAGSNGTKLPPIYMKSLDNELVPVLHRITSGNLGDSPIVLELIFRILNV